MGSQIRFQQKLGVWRQSDESSLIYLSNILNETPKGIMLYEYYKKFGKFQDDQITQLISTIAQYFEEKAIPMFLSSNYCLEKQILERFPTERNFIKRVKKEDLTISAQIGKN